jgi:uncharacterized protein
MPPRLLIDGYNVIKRTLMGGPSAFLDMDRARTSFIERLAGYKRAKGSGVTVVFDAPGSLTVNRCRENHRGVDVIYSGRGETADDVIVEILRKRSPGLVLVSSDRALIDEAKKNGIAFITADRIASLLEERQETEEETRGEKRGNPRRLPKKLRRAKKTLDKI